MTHDELIPQFSDLDRKRFNWDNFSCGLFMFVLGLAKKVLIADTFGNAANWGFANIEILDATNAILASLAYTIQIYFDFSGYSDMAIGLGKMMNFDLPVNFDSPYKALTITEFWSRWHKTLTRFFTKYIYIPMGGNRRGKVRTYINVFTIFFLSGIWHGANWTFILWGCLHGLFMIVTRHFKTWFDKLHPALNWLITFGFVNSTWIFFRADSISDGAKMLGKIASLRFGLIDRNIYTAFNLPELELLANLLTPVDILKVYPYFYFLIAFAGAFIIMLGAQNAHERMMKFEPGWKNMMAVTILIVWCVISFSGVSTFLYFNF